MQGFYVIIPVSYLLVTSDALESQCTSSEGPFDPAFLLQEGIGAIRSIFDSWRTAQRNPFAPILQWRCAAVAAVATVVLMALAGASSPAFWSLNQRGFYCDAVATMQHQFCESVSHWTSVQCRVKDGGFPTCNIHPKPSICLRLQKFLWFSAITVGTNHPHCFYTLQRWPAFLGFVAFIHTSSVLLDFDNQSPSWSVSDHLTRSAFGNLTRYWGVFAYFFYLNRSLTAHPNLNLRKFLDRNQPFQPVCDSLPIPDTTHAN